MPGKKVRIAEKDTVTKSKAPTTVPSSSKNERKKPSENPSVKPGSDKRKPSATSSSHTNGDRNSVKNPPPPVEDKNPPPPVEVKNPPEDNEEETEAVKPESSEEHICGNNKKNQVYDLSKIPAPVRLNAKRKTAIDYICDGVPKPQGYVPEKIMPSWLDYPFSKMLPTIPAPKEYLYYSRGGIGEKLHRNNNHYTVYDPNNKEMVVSNPYSSLHDHNTKDFYNKPLVHRQLVKQGLISPTNKAICDMKEFNDYRQYLFKRIYVEDVNEVLRDKDAHTSALQKAIQMTRKEQDATSGKGFIKNQRIKEAKDLKQKQIMARLLIGMDQKRDAEQHNKRYTKLKQNIADERRIFNEVQEKARRENLERVEKERLNARAILIKDIAASDKANTDRRKHDQSLIKRAHKQFQLEWMDAKWDYQKISINKQKLVNHTMDYNTQTNGQIRQDKVETLRSHMPQIIAKRKAEQKRLWDNVRKFFNRWRDNVRKRKELRPDAMHKSNWEISTGFEGTLEYLRKESGYEKLDDFIMGIVALKKRIKIELDAEEAAEAAASTEAGLKSTPSGGSGGGTHSKPIVNDTNTEEEEARPTLAG